MSVKWATFVATCVIFFVGALLSRTPAITVSDECVDDWSLMQAARLNFDSVRTLEDIEFCVAHAASRFSDASLFIDWIEGHELGTTLVTEISLRDMKAIYGEDGEGMRIGLSIPQEKIPVKFGWLDRWIVYGIFISTILDENGMPISTQVTANRT